MFVTLEGPEGSGKTTLCARLEHMLADKGYEVVCVREPGGTVIGQQVRDVLLDQGNTGMLPETEFLLFSASCLRSAFVVASLNSLIKDQYLIC